jgi:glucose/arabinose dehydrogenase
MPPGRRPSLAVGFALVLAAAVACGGSPVAVDGTSGAAPAAVPTDLVSATMGVPAELAAAPFDRARQVLLPPGWTMSLWARVPEARLAAWTPDGALLVSRPGAGQVVRIVPGGPAGASSSVLLDGLDQPHGLAFDGDTLYVAESDQVDAYRYARGTATEPRTVAGGLPDAKSAELGGAYAHALKSVAIGPDGSLYVSIGSTGNVTPVDRSATPERATIMRLAPGSTKLAVFAQGVRNGTGLAVDPNGAVWTAVNNRDNTAYPYAKDWDGDGKSDQGKVMQSYVNDHPVEPLAKLTQGRDLGWPYCNPDPDLTPGNPKSALSYTNRPFVRDIQFNADGSKLDCASLPPVEQAMGAHSAPLGLSFATTPGLAGGYGPGALVGVHGSWNAQPPRAPEVSFFPWANGNLGKQQTLVGGFQATDGSRWGRPVAAVIGPDHAIYISDDQAGAVYRLVAPGQ